MTWFKVDDGLAFHGKTVAAGVAAMGLWVRAGAWSSQHLTDGFIPEHMVPALSDGQVELAARLVSVGFWVEAPAGPVGFLFHEWGDRNPTAEQVKEQRRKEAARKAEWRAQQERNAAASENGSSSHDYVPTGQQRPSHSDNSVGPDGTKSSVPEGVPVLSHSSRPVPVPNELFPTDVQTRTTSSADADGLFDEFWKAFPRRLQKQDAIKAWKQQLKKKVTPQQMIAGALGYGEHVLKEGMELRYVKYPASWLRAGGYDDFQPEPEAAPDTREPVEILRELWRQADAPAVMRILGMRHSWVDEDPPDDTISREQFVAERRKNWINAHFEAALAVLSAMQQVTA